MQLFFFNNTYGPEFDVNGDGTASIVSDVPCLASIVEDYTGLPVTDIQNSVFSVPRSELR